MKKILKNKYILFFIILLDIFFAIIIFKYSFIYGLLFLLMNLLLPFLFLKIHFNVSIINFDKIKNKYLSNKIRKKISNDERYSKIIKIETFDGSGGTTHPCVMYFQNGFNNYKYWMVHTPYDDNNVELENPCIAVSNDGINFIIPKGIKNPLLPIIKQHGNVLKYYSDNCFLYDNGTLQIWYRYTEEDKSGKKPKLVNKIFRIISNDGINYSEPELMIDNDGIWYLSPSIIKIKQIYYIYYFDKDLKCYCRTSKDLKKWSMNKEIIMEEYCGNFWHGEVKQVQNKLYFLFLSREYELYMSETSIDKPFVFTNCQKLNLNFYDNINIYGNYHKYKSSFIVDDNHINLYIPYSVDTINWFNIKKVKHIKWTMTNTFLKKDNYNKYIKKNNN